MVTPVTPAEITAAQKRPFDPTVIEIVNALLLRNVSQGVGHLSLNEVLSALALKGYSQETVFAKNLLDFKPVYTKAGWKVTYFSKGHKDLASAFWTFYA